MPAVWTPIGSSPRSVQAVQALTEAAPSVASDGVLLEGVESIVPVIHAPGGQTFTGGSLLGYIYTGTAWVRAPQSDVLLDNYVGLSDASLSALIVDSPRGRFQFVPNAVTLSGAGTTITTEYFCTTKTGTGIRA